MLILILEISKICKEIYRILSPYVNFTNDKVQENKLETGKEKNLTSSKLYKFNSMNPPIIDPEEKFDYFFSNDPELFGKLIDSIKNQEKERFDEILPKICNLNSCDNLGNTPLYHAVNSEFVYGAEKIIDQWIDVFAGDGQYVIPLHKAVTMGNVDVVRYLIENNVGDSQDKLLESYNSNSGITAWNLATLYGHRDILKLLKPYYEILDVSTDIISFDSEDNSFDVSCFIAENVNEQYLDCKLGYLIGQGFDINK